MKDLKEINVLMRQREFSQIKMWIVQPELKGVHTKVQVVPMAFFFYDFRLNVLDNSTGRLLMIL